MIYGQTCTLEPYVKWLQFFKMGRKYMNHEVNTCKPLGQNKIGHNLCKWNLKWLKCDITSKADG